MGLPEDDVAAAAFGEESEASSTLAGWADAIVLVDIGRIDPETELALIDWVQKGGLLIRFAGPKLAALAIEREKRDAASATRRPRIDPLLPVRLQRRRQGAWRRAELDQASTSGGVSRSDSPFAGLVSPRRKRPCRARFWRSRAQTPSEEVWARLADGTPLVTAREEGEGRVVLFHITANSSWSSLPLAGLVRRYDGPLWLRRPLRYPGLLAMFPRESSQTDKPAPQLA